MTGMGSASLLLVACLFIVWLGRASGRGSLGRNQLVGIRTKWTMSSDERWAAGHRAGARRILIGGVGGAAICALAILSGVLVLLGVAESVTNGVIAALVIGSSAWLVAWMIAATVSANRAAKALPD